jgi:hypothetical protein
MPFCNPAHGDSITKITKASNDSGQERGKGVSGVLESAIMPAQPPWDGQVPLSYVKFDIAARKSVIGKGKAPSPTIFRYRFK